MHEGAIVELTDGRDVVAAIWESAGERRRPVLVELRGIRGLSREAREYFLSDDAAGKLCAVALVATSPVSKVIGNFFLRSGEHRVPTSIFDGEEGARAWLGEHLA